MERTFIVREKELENLSKHAKGSQNDAEARIINSTIHRDVLGRKPQKPNQELQKERAQLQKHAEETPIYDTLG